MYDTRPDVKSYGHAFRRLWWIPVVLAILAGFAGSMTGSSKVHRATGTLRLQDPAALAAVSSMSNLYDVKAMSSRMVDRLTAIDTVEDLSVGLALDPTVIQVDFETVGDDTEKSLEAVNEVIGDVWAEVFSETIAPARDWMNTSVERLSAQLAALDHLESDTAALERADVGTSLAAVQANVAALDSMEDSGPVLQNVEVQGSSGGRLRTVMMLAAAVFVGCGVVIAIGLFDQRVRRRSILERNGLTVVAVNGPDSGGLEVVAAALVSANDGSAVGEVLVAGCGKRSDTSGLESALNSDGMIGDVVVVEDLLDRSEEFVGSSRNADVVVISVPYAGCSYVTVLEAARTAVTGGAHDVCAVLEVPKRGALGEALS